MKALLLMQNISVIDVYAEDELGPERQRDHRYHLIGVIIVASTFAVLAAYMIGSWYL